MDTKSFVARFEAERQALALMDHPSIAKVFDAGATGTGRPYFVMELAAGVPITRFCDQKGFNLQQRLSLFVQVCRAIQHAHQKGVIHRDIKPSNILVEDHEGVPLPKVIDFGIAKATGDQRLTDLTVVTTAEQFLGTPAYMSPEQASRGALDIDTRSDIYSLGVLLYELLTSSTPFARTGDNMTGLDELWRAIRENEPAPPSARLARMSKEQLAAAARNRQIDPGALARSLRGDLDCMVMKSLEKDRTRRYETANGFAADIDRHLHGEPVIARAASAAYRFQKTLRRHKLEFATGAAIFGALVLGLAISISSSRQTEKALRRAVTAEQAEEMLRREAQQSARESRSALAASDFLEAGRLVEADENAKAVAYLARALSLEPQNSAALTLLAMQLSYHSWMIPVVAVTHGGAISRAEFSPDGTCFVTASADHTARVWNTMTGEAITMALSHEKDVVCARFSPDCQRVATASADQTARLWDAHTGQPLSAPLVHTGPVVDVQFSPDGKRLLTASSDHTARLWDGVTGTPSGQPLRHRDNISTATFSPDGLRIVTASWDHRAQIWDARTGEALGAPLAHKDTVWFAQFSPDGQMVVTASADGTARVWDGHTGLPLGPALTPGSWVTAAEFSPDNRRVITAARNNAAQVWDAQSGEMLLPPLQHENWVTSAEFSPDGSRILTASPDTTARVWDSLSGVALTEPFEQSAGINSAHFSPDGKRILTASNDGTAQVWKLVSGWQLAEGLRHGDTVNSAQFDRSGTRLVTASQDHTARVWNAKSGHPVGEPLLHSGPVASALFSQDGQYVLTSSADNAARVWDASTGKLLFPPLRHNGGINSASFSPDGRFVLTASADNMARVWNARSGQLVASLGGHTASVLSAAFSPNGEQVATASADFTARLWDTRTGRLLSKPMAHHYFVNSVEFSPNGRLAVTASADNTALVWSTRTGSPATEPLKHENWVVSAHFSADGQRIVTASWDWTARIWDAQTGHPLAQPLRHRGKVNSAQFSPDGKFVITSCDDYAQLWDSQTGQPLSGPLKHGRAVAYAQFSPDGARAVTVADDHFARVWDVSFAPSNCPPWLFDLAEALSGHRLDNQGALEPAAGRAEALQRIRGVLDHQPEAADGVRWGRWLLADAEARSISPLCEVHQPEFIETELADGSVESLDFVARLQSRSSELPPRVAQTRASLVQIETLQLEAGRLAASGKYPDAEAAYRQALQRSREISAGERIKWQGSMGGLFAVLGHQAMQLCRDGKPDEAERRYREALALANDYADPFDGWEEAVAGLAEILKRQGRVEDLEAVFMDLAKPFSVGQSQDASALYRRGDSFARRGLWDEACADMAVASEVEPDNHWYRYELVALLARGKDRELYPRQCAQMLAHFGQSEDAAICERVAKVCLILPTDTLDLEAVNRVADRALSRGKGNAFYPYFEFAKGLSEYRLGHFAEAAEWMRKTLAAPSADFRDAEACLVLAMSLRHSGHDAESRSALDKAALIVRTKLPKPESGDLGDFWHDWIFVHALLEEAQTQIEPVH
jgi:WD40 repeat protein